MDELAIKDILLKDIYTSKIFLNVYARDELPLEVPYPSCLILNNKPRSHPGEHWLAIYFDKNKIGYFFDSYGNKPHHYNLSPYLELVTKQYLYNSRKIQGASEYCGFYCILFLLLISRNELSKFFSYFTTNTYLNDKKIYQLIKNN
jgi:hypothetical protein